MSTFQPTRAQVIKEAVRKWSSAAASALGRVKDALGYEDDDDRDGTAEEEEEGVGVDAKPMRPPLAQGTTVYSSPLLLGLLSSLLGSPPRVEGRFLPGVSDEGGVLLDACRRLGWVEVRDSLYIWHGAGDVDVALFKVDACLLRLAEMRKRGPKDGACVGRIRNLLAVRRGLESAKASAEVVDALMGARDAMKGLRVDVEEVRSVLVWRGWWRKRREIHEKTTRRGLDDRREGRNFTLLARHE